MKAMPETPIDLQEKIDQVMTRLSQIKRDKRKVGMAIHNLIIAKATKEYKEYYDELVEMARQYNIEAEGLNKIRARLQEELKLSSIIAEASQIVQVRISKQQKQKEAVNADTLRDRKEVARFIIQAANNQIDRKQLGIAINVLQEITAAPLIERCADLQKQVDDLQKHNTQLQSKQIQQPMPTPSKSLRLLRRLWCDRFRVSDPVRQAQGYISAMYLSPDDESEVRETLGEVAL